MTISDVRKLRLTAQCPDRYGTLVFKNGRVWRKLSDGLWPYNQRRIPDDGWTEAHDE